jgi:ribulose-phosphate 3-epimerase
LSRVRVIPALLTDDPGTLEKMVRQAETFTDYIQLDIMDGQFVPSRSVSASDLARIPIRLTWEVHLMVYNAEEYFSDFYKAGAQRVIFHYEAAPSPKPVINSARDLGLGVGLALNPETPVAAVMPFIGDIDSILLLSVNPGFYGSPFIPEVLDKVAELRTARPEIEIGIDGGIKESNIAQVARTGVDAICVGSAISLQPEPGESYHHLQLLADEAVSKGQKIGS